MTKALLKYCNTNSNIPYGQSSAKLPVTRSLGHLVTWSLGHLVTRSLGHLVTWSHGHLVTQSYGHYFQHDHGRTDERTDNIRTSRSASQTIK